MTYKLNADQEVWLCDLETTEEPQCHTFLHSRQEGNKGFCCLGRACVVLIPELEEIGYTYSKFDGSTASLPFTVMERLKLRNDLGQLACNVDNCCTLSGLNDSGRWSFKRIAAFIRLNPTAVFK